MDTQNLLLSMPTGLRRKKLRPKRECVQRKKSVRGLPEKELKPRQGHVQKKSRRESPEKKRKQGQEHALKKKHVKRLRLRSEHMSKQEEKR